MLYNDIVTYSQINITYTGTVNISIPSILDTIVLGNITVLILTEPDFSNATTIGFVTYDFAPTGVLTIEATAEQAQALVGAEIIYINSASGEILTIQTTAEQTEALVAAEIGYINSVSGEISIETI